MTIPAVLQHSWIVASRYLHATLRNPLWIVATLVQPLIWLLLFGSLFKTVVELPGFDAGNYADFITPGIVAMNALFAAGFSGMALLYDRDRGILDRFLTTPAHGLALIAGRLLQQSIVTAVQSLVIIGLGLAVTGASFQGGALGALVVTAAAILLGMAIGALSNAVALLVLNENTLYAVVTTLTLPLSFLSGTFMDLDLAPSWIRMLAKFNPVEWAVVAGREALTSEDVDWVLVGSRLGLLLALVVVAGVIASRAFRSYQRSV